MDDLAKKIGPRLWLVRHGQTDWNAAGRVQGHTPTNLNDEGRREAARLAELLAARVRGGGKFAAIWSSDLPRAFQTAEAIGKALGLPVQKTEVLRERSFGKYEGSTADQVKEARAALGLSQTGDLADWTGMPGIETNESVWARVQEKLLELTREYAANQDIVVATHGGVIVRAMYQVLGIPDGTPRRFSLANGIVAVLEWRLGAFRLLTLADMELLCGDGESQDTATVAELKK